MAILRNRSLVIIGLAESVSGLGNWVTMLAVFAIVVFRGEGGVAQSSGIFLAGLLPALPAGPLAGWLCDRYDRKWLMIASELLDGLTVAGLIFVRRIELIYALLAVQAVVMSIMTPARQAALPDIVPPEELTRANALLQQLSSFIKIGGPVLAGLALALVDPHTAIVLDVVSFALSAAILTRLPSLRPHARRAESQAGGSRRETVFPPQTPRPDGRKGNLFDGLLNGEAAVALRGSAGLRLLFAGLFLCIVVIIGFDVLSSVVTRDVLGGNEGFFGLLVSLVGLGSAAAAALLLLRRGEHDPWQDMLLGLALLACLPACLALAALAGPGLARVMAAAGCLIGGVGNGLVNVQVSTLLQRLSPPEVLGRLAGLFQSTLLAGQLVGILITPLLVPHLLAPAGYFGASTVAIVMLAAYVGRTARRTRLAEGAA